jgi:hypothetical protein
LVRRFLRANPDKKIAIISVNTSLKSIIISWKSVK